MKIYKLCENLLCVPEYDVVIRSENGRENIEQIVTNLLPDNKKTNIEMFKQLSALNNLCTNKIGVFLTTACQLKCKYCYYDSDNIHTRRNPEILNKAQMKKILETVFDSAILISCITKTDPVAFITVSGGGEPTIYWENFEYFVNEIRKRELELGVKTEINLVCNGILNRNQQEYVMKNINHVTLSYDGIPDIQRKQRWGGETDHALIESTLDYFSTKKYNYTIRVTVLPENVDKISDICKYLFERYCNLKKITFEPVAYSGRAQILEQKEDVKIKFLEEYIKAYYMVQKEYGKRIGCSLFPNTLRPSFCGAWIGASPWIDAEGYIMPCNEKIDRNAYSIGRINRDGKLEYYKPEKRFHDELRDDQIRGCKDCMASYYCNGGCPIVFKRDNLGNLCTESAKMNCKMVSEYWKRIYIKIGCNEEFLNYWPQEIYADEDRKIKIYRVREKE